MFISWFVIPSLLRLSVIMTRSIILQLTPSLPPSPPPTKLAFTTRALAPSTRKATPTASRAAHGFSRSSSRGGAKTGRVVRVPFLNQGLAKAAHTRLFSTTEDAASAAAAPVATEAEVSLL